MRDSDRSVRKWWYLPAISMATIGTVAIAVGAVPRSFNTGDTLTAADLNANFAALEQRTAALETGQVTRKIARAHGKGPNETTTNGAIATRLLQYTKIQEETGVRIVWTDNLRCLGTAVSCEWEIKIDGASCAMPGPLRFDLYNDAAGVVVNIHGPRTLAATCFGISKGPHTVQVYVTAPVPNPVGGGGVTSAGTAYTGWNVAYWSIEVEEVN